MTDNKPNQSLNFPGIEDRVELEHHVKTSHDDYTDDTQGDPEGAMTRAEKRDTLEFPEWVYGNFMLSSKTYYGKSWPDGGKHLIPREVVVREIMSVHEESMENEALEGCLRLGLSLDGFESFKENYLNLIDNAPQFAQFDIMNGLQNSVERALARRAISKYRYLEAADRTGTKEEYLSDLYSYAMRDATQAGALIWIHRDAWRSLQWKSEPKYIRVQNAVVLEQISAAKRVEEKYGTASNVKQATTGDYAKTVMMF